MKTETKAKLIGLIKYVVLNSIFAAALYFGFIDVGHEYAEGANNFAVFIGWCYVVIGLIVIVGLTIDEQENNPRKGELTEKLARTMTPSVVPFAFDLMYDLCVLAIFIWFGHYVLAAFYITSIYAGKALRNVPKDVMLRNLKSQGYKT